MTVSIAPALFRCRPMGDPTKDLAARYNAALLAKGVVDRKWTVNAAGELRMVSTGVPQPEPVKQEDLPL